jgi:hypothetical protein
MDNSRKIAVLQEPDSHAREWEAWNYRRQGFTYRKIGNLMGIHPCAAHEYVTKAAKIIAVDDVLQVQQAQQIEFDRLDALLLVAMTTMGDENRPAKIRLAAIDRMLSISKRRSKLLGLDNAPRPAEDSFILDKDQLIREIRERFQEARAKLAAEAAAQLPQESDESNEDDAAVTPSCSLTE